MAQQIDVEKMIEFVKALSGEVPKAKENQAQPDDKQFRHATILKHIYKQRGVTTGLIPPVYSFRVYDQRENKYIYEDPERYATQSRAKRAFDESAWKDKVHMVDYDSVNDANNYEVGECNNPNYELEDEEDENI